MSSSEREGTSWSNNSNPFYWWAKGRVDVSAANGTWRELAGIVFITKRRTSRPSGKNFPFLVTPNAPFNNGRPPRKNKLDYGRNEAMPMSNK